MKVLVVGSGGREHALAWKIAASPRVERVLAAPGSAGMALQADCFPEVQVSDCDGLLELARRESVDLVVIGPENPLAEGVADRLREAGLAVFGPSAAAARLEGSKAFAKDFMVRHGIPTAAYAAFDSLEPALAYVREQGGACVVKADGLAAGKGVAMCATPAEAEAALREMMGERRFGDAGDRVVVEEWMQGEEASYYAITDGERIVTLAAAQDHKRALDGDEGENTGGMGAYSPAPVVTPQVEKQVLESIVYPTIRGMAADGCPYVGVLYVGLMIDSAGNPRVVEFNVRFGDPETQPLMARMEGDLVPLLDGAARGALDTRHEVGWGDAAVCVVLASGGYPRAFEKGRVIAGLAADGGPADGDSQVVVFHAGTRRGEDGAFETSGGRVLGVTAWGATVEEARDRAYRAVSRIGFEGVQYRRDIASRALGR
ncbi:MAG: phosphoribosylamine--glycine ligase [Deltaproteobacteria bacterium]|nr:phosphoribosylamine--glycine ligase [Deltaproteobacteria bacterium]MBW2419004.1 phosphoribosylamine--glycine ligase [Deltaproteobacteria bacterium]